MMIKLGLHCNYWNGILPELKPYTVLKLMTDCGAQAMDFSTAIAMKMSASERQCYSSAAENSNIVLSMNGGMPSADISNPEPALRVMGVNACKQAIEVASDLHCRVWSGVICTPWLAMPEDCFTAEKKRERWNLAVESLQKLCDYAAPLGVAINLELVNRFEGYLLNNCADGLRMTEDVGRDNLMLLLDSFHMNIEEDSSVNALNAAMAANRLGHIHVSESNRRLPGLKNTDMPWDKILPALRIGGYDGSVIVESMVLSSSPAARSFFTWRDMTAEPSLNNMIKEACESLNFIRQYL